MLINTPLKKPPFYSCSTTTMTEQNTAKESVEIDSVTRARPTIRASKKSSLGAEANASQEQFYVDVAQPLLKHALSGQHTCIIAHGASGSGKTHTLLGSPKVPGVIRLLLSELFTVSISLQIEILFFEVFNETVRDLLRPGYDPKLLNLYENENKQVMVTNLVWQSCGLIEEALGVIDTGSSNRTTQCTETNAKSSRSHAVIQVRLGLLVKNGKPKYGSVSVFDLAGSVPTPGDGKLSQESKYINRLLLAFNRCIHASKTPGNVSSTWFRDSKLTRFLKFSLSGACTTVTITCTLEPEPDHGTIDHVEPICRKRPAVSDEQWIESAAKRSRNEGSVRRMEKMTRRRRSTKSQSMDSSGQDSPPLLSQLVQMATLTPQAKKYLNFHDYILSRDGPVDSFESGDLSLNWSNRSTVALEKLFGTQSASPMSQLPRSNGGVASFSSIDNRSCPQIVLKAPHIVCAIDPDQQIGFDKKRGFTWN